MPWVFDSETVFTATQGVIFHGSDIGLSGFPGMFQIIAQNDNPLSPSIAGNASLALGAIFTEPIGADVPDGILVNWTVWEQEQSPPGTPVGDGQNYSWNGVGNTVPSDSGGFDHYDDPWEDAEFQVSLSGTSPYDPTGDTFSVTCRVYTWEDDIKTDWELLPFESGDPGDPGYLYPVDSATATDGILDKRNIVVNWVYSNPGEQDGFGVFAPDDEWYPIAPDVLAGPDDRSFGYSRAFPRDVEQQFFVQSYNATKRAAELTPAVAPVVNVELSPAPGLMPIGSVANFYSLQFTASNGVTADVAYAYAVTAGSLPDGLSLDNVTGLISGIPTLQGDYSFEITASSVDVADSIPSGSWSINIQLVAPLYTLTPPGGNVEPGQIITVEGPDAEELEYVVVFPDKVVPLTPKIIGPNEVWLETPYPPSSACVAALDDCPVCADAVTPCNEDVTSEACQEAMAACIACLIAEMEDIEAAEACNEAAPTTSPPPTFTVVAGTRFSGSVPLGDFVIIEAEGSGLYRFTMGKTNDTLYTAERDGTTYDVKIPNPGGKTGFFRS